MAALGSPGGHPRFRFVEWPHKRIDRDCGIDPVIGFQALLDVRAAIQVVPDLSREIGADLPGDAQARLNRVLRLEIRLNRVEDAVDRIRSGRLKW